MRLRTFTASLVVAAAATLPLAGVATAQPDRDCDDFSSQAEAQAALRPGDPDDLDGNGDGQACENEDYGSSPADEDDGSRDQARDEDDDESREDGDEDGGSDDDRSDDDGQVSVVPRGGVDTGDGSSTPGPAPFVIAGAVAAAVAAGAVRRRAGASR
jgi:hypothetical protein